MFKRLSRRNMVFFIMVSFICTNIIPSASSNQQNLISITILYTGGNGPGNYTQIQDAIDNASSGDTVFVFNGTYYEHIVINKSINLIGDKRNNTIIDGNYDSNAVILIVASDVVVKGFTVKNSEGYSKSAGIKIN